MYSDHASHLSVITRFLSRTVARFHGSASSSQYGAPPCSATGLSLRLENIRPELSGQRRSLLNARANNRDHNGRHPEEGSKGLFLLERQLVHAGNPLSCICHALCLPRLAASCGGQKSHGKKKKNVFRAFLLAQTLLFVWSRVMAIRIETLRAVAF